MVGKPAADEYGGTLGSVVGFTTNVFGDVKTVIVAGANGRLEEYELGRVRVDGEGLTVLSSFSVEFGEIVRAYEQASRQLVILEELVGSGEVNPSVAEPVLREFRASYEELRGRAEELLARIEERLGEIFAVLEKVEETYIYVRLAAEMDGSGGDALRFSLEELNRIKVRLLSERHALEAYRDRLVGLLSGENVIKVSV